MRNLTSIDLFIRVVQLGSLSAAAREANLMPSSVSRQISTLEQEVKAKLFQRTTRRQSLTEAGLLFYDYALGLSKQMNEARDAINSLSASASGTLHVAMEADFSQVFVAPLLTDFFDRYPDIRLRVNLSPNMLDLIENGIDLAIRMGHLEDSSLITKTLTTSHSVLCCTQRYLSDHGIPATPQDLTQHSCHSYKNNSGVITWKFHQDNGVSEVPISGNVRANSLGFLKQIALAHQGIVMMPNWMIQKELMSGELVTVLNHYALMPKGTPIQAVFPSKLMLAPKVRVFIDFLSDKLAHQGGEEFTNITATRTKL